MGKSLVLLSMLTLALVVGVNSGGGCSNDMKSLTAKCMQYVMNPPNPKLPPSGDCCAVVKSTNMPCVCGHITKEVEKMISMEKVVYIANACGRPLAKGSKCGSYKVPPL